MSDKIPGATALHPIEYRGWLIFQDDGELNSSVMWCAHHADYNELHHSDERIAWVFTERAARAFVDDEVNRAHLQGGRDEQ